MDFLYNFPHNVHIKCVEYIEILGKQWLHLILKKKAVQLQANHSQLNCFLTIT